MTSATAATIHGAMFTRAAQDERRQPSRRHPSTGTPRPGRLDGRVRARRSQASSASDRRSAESGTAPTAPRQRRAERRETTRSCPADGARCSQSLSAGRGAATLSGAWTGGRPRFGSRTVKSSARLSRRASNALTTSIAAATESVTALDSTPKGGIAATNQPQTTSATTRAPATTARLDEFKILVSACPPGRRWHRSRSCS